MAYHDDDLEILGANDLNDLTEPERLGGDELEILGGGDLVEITLPEEGGEQLPPAPAAPARVALDTQKVNTGGTRLNVDLTIAIDLTGSMGSLIGVLKRDVVRIRDLVYDRLCDMLVSKGKNRVINRMRVRVIGFRDYNYDWEAALQPWHGPMICSEFFDMDDPYERTALQEFVNKLEATGGVDEPEHALEALHYAIRSDWDRDPNVVHRHVIMLFTDAPAHPMAGDDPEKRNESNVHYPADADMPCDLVQLQAEYNDPALIDQSAQRLLIFAPVDASPWNEMGMWNGATVSNVVPNEGLTEVELETIVTALSGSIGAGG